MTCWEECVSLFKIPVQRKHYKLSRGSCFFTSDTLVSAPITDSKTDLIQAVAPLHNDSELFIVRVRLTMDILTHFNMILLNERHTWLR